MPIETSLQIFRTLRVLKLDIGYDEMNVQMLWRASLYLYSLCTYLSWCIKGSKRKAHNASFKSGNSGPVVNYFLAVAGHFIRRNVWRTMAAETVPRHPE